MNNASKGRCVTVTPRGKARTKHLRQNPGFARGNIVPAARQKTHFTEDHKGHEDRFNRSNREVGGFAGGANLGTAVVGFSPVFARTLSDFFAIFAIFRGYYCLFLAYVDSDLSRSPLSGQKLHCPTITALIYPWQVWERILLIRLRTVNRDPSLLGMLG